MIKLGDLLSSKRREKRLALSQVSESTKIPQKLLIALEEGDFDAFASEVYLKGFLKNYARFLGIDMQKALAIYRRESKKHKEGTLQEAQKPISDPKAIITPGRLVFALTVIIVLSVIIFIAIQVNKIIQPPYLELRDPVQGVAPTELYTEVDTDSITIYGEIEVGSKLIINGNEVNTNNLQEFRVDNYKLNSGSNEIFIVAQSYYFSKTSQIRLTVLSKTEEESEEEVVEEEEVTQDQKEKMDISIEVGPEQAWIVITVDGVSKVADTIQPGVSLTFEAFETFTISSPRPHMIKLSINEEEYSFSSQAPGIFKLVSGNVVQE